MEHPPYFTVLFLATLSGMTTVIGVWLAIYVSRRARWIATGIGFSVGIMLLISFFELIPESLAMAKPTNVIAAVISGAALIGVLHYVIPHTHLFEESGIMGTQVLRSSYLAVFGLILHDFPEGFAMANAYITSPGMGVAVALAIALHNIPEEFAMAVPAAATKSRRFLFGAAILSGLAEPIGASIGLFASNISPDMVPLFMALAAGAMIFVSLHELLPMARQYGRLHFFGLGIATSAVVYLVLLLMIPE
jgi:ZIP family zinc transporter